MFGTYFGSIFTQVNAQIEEEQAKLINARFRKQLISTGKSLFKIIFSIDEL